MCIHLISMFVDIGKNMFETNDAKLLTKKTHKFYNFNSVGERTSAQ